MERQGEKKDGYDRNWIDEKVNVKAQSRENRAGGERTYRIRFLLRGGESGLRGGKEETLY